jgi:hypothetical protein
MPLNTEYYQQTSDLLKSLSMYNTTICDFAVPITDRRRLLTAEARVHARTRPVGFMSDTWLWRRFPPLLRTHLYNCPEVCDKPISQHGPGSRFGLASGPEFRRAQSKYVNLNRYVRGRASCSFVNLKHGKIK